jgi:nucleoid-associated protein YgaU
VVDRGRATFGLSSLGDRRQLGQIGLVVLMAAALGALFLARLSPPETPGLAGAGSPTPHESVNVTARTSPYASASPVVSPAPSASLIPGSPTPAPTHARTYTIKSGDTLSSIAAHFHTTAKILEQLNGIKSPFVIHPGEVLKLP